MLSTVRCVAVSGGTSFGSTSRTASLPDCRCVFSMTMLRTTHEWLARLRTETSVDPPQMGRPRHRLPLALHRCSLPSVVLRPHASNACWLIISTTQRGVDTEALIKIESSYSKLQLEMDTLIARIPARGIPEKGFDSFSLGECLASEPERASHRPLARSDGLYVFGRGSCPPCCRPRLLYCSKGYSWKAGKRRLNEINADGTGEGTSIPVRIRIMPYLA